MSTTAPAVPTDAAIHEILVDRIDNQRRSVGIVVGVVTPEGRRTVSHGDLDHDDARPLNGDTVFELASVTKIFTALALADMVHRREVALDDPVQRYVPSGARIPSRNGRQITLGDLATHTSGLPVVPADYPRLDRLGAAEYSLDQMYRFLSTFELTRDPGSEWEYANLDMALLGHALAFRAGMGYETLIRTRITGPLGMDSTSTLVSPQIETRCAVSHDADLRPAPRVALGALGPAGAMLSTTNDLLRLLAACLAIEASPLAPAMRLMLETRRPRRLSPLTMIRRHWRLMLWILSHRRGGARVPRIGTDQALGWYVHRRDGDEMVVHDGAGLTCAASIAYDVRSSVGVVVLSNTGTMVHDLSRHLLWAWPLGKARRQIALDASLLDRYVGEYRSFSGPAFTVAREGSRLVLDIPSVGRVQLRPENECDFFVVEFTLGFTFELNRHGRVVRAIFQPGRGAPDMPMWKRPSREGRATAGSTH